MISYKGSVTKDGEKRRRRRGEHLPPCEVNRVVGKTEREVILLKCNLYVTFELHVQE